MRRAFSLLELVIVIGVLGILFALFLPAVQEAREAANRAACLNNLRQIGLALHSFEQAHGYFPKRDRNQATANWEKLNGARWLAFLLPYLEQEALWESTRNAFAIAPNVFEPPHDANAGTVIRLFVCHSDGRLLAENSPLFQRPKALTTYLGVAGSSIPTALAAYDGVLTAGYKTVRLADILDGASNTLAVGERPANRLLDRGYWYQGNLGGPQIDQSLILTVTAPANPLLYGYCGPSPNSDKFVYGPGSIDNPCDSLHFWSLHSGGSNFLFADGSVRFLAYAARPIMPALASRAGGELINFEE